MSDKSTKDPIFARKGVIFRVQEARERDVGRSIVRLDNKIMESLDLHTGDIVELEGKNVTAGIVWPAYPQDQDSGIVRIDSLLRMNARVNINETVQIRKVNALEAELVTLSPVAVGFRSYPKFEEFAQKKLVNCPLALNNEISISIGINRKISFQVVCLRPPGICIVKKHTAIEIKNLTVPGKLNEDVDLFEGELETLAIARNILLKLKEPSQSDIELAKDGDSASINQEAISLLENLLEMRTPPTTSEDGALYYPTKYPKIFFKKRKDGKYCIVHVKDDKK